MWPIFAGIYMRRNPIGRANVVYAALFRSSDRLRPRATLYVDARARRKRTSGGPRNEARPGGRRVPMLGGVGRKRG